MLERTWARHIGGLGVWESAIFRPAPLVIRKLKNQHANSIRQEHPPRLRESKMLGVATRIL